MAKTGTSSRPGTAEGAAMGRAMHAMYADSPVLSDTWAIHLLSVQERERLLAGTHTTTIGENATFDPSPIFAVNVGCLRFAEDEIERSVRAGIDQYLVLGAGLDTFALRREDLKDIVCVFEADHPDVQFLKRERIDAATDVPAQMPSFISIDFESQNLLQEVGRSAFSSEKPSVVSWLNTLHYLTEYAIRSSLGMLRELMAAESRLILNYSPDVPFTDEQVEFISALLTYTDAAGEPMASRWTPADFSALLKDSGFEIVEHVDEEGLTERYFSDRQDGLKPGIPLRAVIARRLP